MTVVYNKIQFEWRCNETTEPILFQILASSIPVYLTDGNSYIYNGPSANGLIQGQCYTYYNAGLNDTVLPTAPLVGNFTEVDRNSEDCLGPCSTHYTLNDCCTNLPINWPPNEEGLQGTLYLEFFGSCNEGDFNNVPCPSDLNNLIITEILNEAQLNITGCLKLTEVSETDIPEGADVGDWGRVMTEVTTVPTCADCQECCYKLTNCETNEIIYSNTTTIVQYLNKFVKINGYEGCWEVTFSEDICTCPVPLTVLQSYDTCPACLPIVAYKFTNCNNSSLVKYSTENYSSYVGKTVELECGDCWSVSQIDYNPPSTQVIEIQHTFDTCLACNRTYYKLVDCLNPNAGFVYTYTDLSDYIGKAIKIKGCDTCFTVEEETREPVNPGIVELIDSYIDCPTCLETFPCVCSRISNNTDIEQTYCYIDCDFIQQNITLQPGESSDKVCVLKWIICPIPCDCLNTTYYEEEIADPTLTYTLNLELLTTGETYNGKPIYQDCFNSNPACVPPSLTDSCFTVKYESDDCWYGAFTNNCVTNVHAVFKNCSETYCPTGTWEYIPCTRIFVSIGGEVPLQAILTVNDYTQTPFSYGNETSLSISFNSVANQWEMKFDGEVFATLAGNLSICGTQENPVTWSGGFAAPQTWDPDSYILHTLNTSNCNTQVVSDKIEGYIEYYGDCIDKECPVIPLPKRKIKPGYSVPTCDIEKWEKITCKSSEILYKEVMRLRYGISNCCPDEDDKWLIKKELIDFAALVDPDYVCTPVQSCGCPPSSCGCNCSSTLKTCNSQ